MKCPHCGEEIEKNEPAPARVVIEGIRYSVDAQMNLPMSKVARNKFYSYRAPDVERPVLVLVSPHEH